MHAHLEVEQLLELYLGEEPVGLPPVQHFGGVFGKFVDQGFFHTVGRRNDHI